MACGQVVGRDGLGDVAPGAGPDHRDHVLGGVGDRQRQEHEVGERRLQRLDDRLAAPAGEVDVEQHHLGLGGPDPLHGRLDVAASPSTVDAVAQLGPHAGAEHLVVVDEEHGGQRGGHPPTSSSRARRRRGRVGSPSRTLGTSTTISVPSPRVLCTSALPPWRAMRPRIDSRTPSRPGSTWPGRSPCRGRARTRSPCRARPRRRPTPPAPRRGAAALWAASRTAATRLSTARSSGQSPTTTRSTSTSWRSSTSVTTRLEGGRRGRRHDRPPGPARRRARPAAPAPGGGPACGRGRGLSAWRWIRVRVCSTESWRWAAISDRSSDRMRCRRSPSRSRHSRTIHGPRSSATPTPVASMARPSLPTTDSRPPGARSRNTRPSTSRAPPAMARATTTRPLAADVVAARSTAGEVHPALAPLVGGAGPHHREPRRARWPPTTPARPGR